MGGCRKKICCEGRLGIQDVFSSSLVKSNIWFLQYPHILNWNVNAVEFKWVYIMFEVLSLGIIIIICE